MTAQTPVCVNCAEAPRQCNEWCIQCTVDFYVANPAEDFP
jgi:hypothetical protein